MDSSLELTGSEVKATSDGTLITEEFDLVIGSGSNSGEKSANPAEPASSDWAELRVQTGTGKAFSTSKFIT